MNDPQPKTDPAAELDKRLNATATRLGNAISETAGRMGPGARLVRPDHQELVAIVREIGDYVLDLPTACKADSVQGGQQDAGQGNYSTPTRQPQAKDQGQ